MNHKAIYHDSRVTITAARHSTGLVIVSTDEEGDTTRCGIPSDKIESFIKNLTEVATAPEWTRAKFVRVIPKGAGPEFVMVRETDETWTDEYGAHLSTDALLSQSGKLGFEIIA